MKFSFFKMVFFYTRSLIFKSYLFHTKNITFSQKKMKKNTIYLNPKQSEALKNIESIVGKTLPRVKKREDTLKSDLQCVIINNINITGLYFV